MVIKSAINWWKLLWVQFELLQTCCKATQKIPEIIKPQELKNEQNDKKAGTPKKQTGRLTETNC